MSRGLLLVISGPAGSGKGTVIKYLMEKERDIAYSFSATTRSPRPGEVDGVNYHFISVDEFKSRIEHGGILEYTEYCGNFYGTPKKEAEDVLDAGKNLILEIEVEGAANVKRICPDAVLIMLLPPSHAEQERRLRGRGTEPEDKILARLAQAREEIKQLGIYDYIVYNQDGAAEECAQDISSIIRAERLSRRRNPDAESKFLGN